MAKKNFEKALADLENIVQRLDENDLSLDEALSLFEEGIKLSRFCSQKLDSVEDKVEILLRDDEGDLKKEPFENSDS
jgi:exodeoxyribonuclease VII small subunit